MDNDKITFSNWDKAEPIKEEIFLDIEDHSNEVFNMHLPKKEPYKDVPFSTFVPRETEENKKKSKDNITEEVPEHAINMHLPHIEEINKPILQETKTEDQQEEKQEERPVEEIEEEKEFAAEITFENTTKNEFKNPDENKEATHQEDQPNNEEKNILAIAGLQKYYGKKYVVKGISFAMKSGDVVGLLGPNGAGKTTTFFMIVGFIKAYGGKIFINGEDITNLPMFERSRKGLAYLPQEPSVFRKLSVENNIRLVLDNRKELTPEQRDEELERLLDEFGIANLRKQPGYTLSGGERRRCEIARCLASKPKFLLLDEPFAGIDPIAVKEIKNIIKHLSSKGIGVLITDHNVRDALAVTTCGYIINNGSILVSGTREELMQNKTAIDVYFGTDFNESSN